MVMLSRYGPPADAHPPIAITYFGSGIWSYSRLMNGAIFTDTQPDTMRTSACRGVARKNIPKRSRSYFEAAVAIISIAQQDRPNVSDQSEFLRAHCASRSSGATRAAPPGTGMRHESISSCD